MNSTSPEGPLGAVDTRLEKDIQRDILAYLRQVGVLHWRQNAGKIGWVTLGPEGISDIVVVLPPNGRFLALEVKAHKGRLRPAQKAFKGELERFGGLYRVVRSPHQAWVALREALEYELSGHSSHLYRGIQEALCTPPTISPPSRRKKRRVARTGPGTNRGRKVASNRLQPAGRSNNCKRKQ